MIRTLLFLGLCAIIEKSSGEDIPEHIKYLTNFGYLETPKEGGSPDSFSADEIESALKHAQTFAGIPATGKLDNQTIRLLSTPRCGFPDTGSRLKRYDTTTKWNKRDVTYGLIKYSPQLRPDLTEGVIRQALDKWTGPSGLRFHPVNGEMADIRIGFFQGDHGDGVNLDRNALAHAYQPGPNLGGDVHFNDAFPWKIGYYDPRRGEYLLLSTAIHELGHSMGLGHSDVYGSVMRPVYSGLTDLGQDDVLGIQALYRNPYG